MSDLASKSIPTTAPPEPDDPLSWEQSPGIREHLIAHFPAVLAEPLRGMGRYLYDQVVERDLVPADDHWTRTRVLALVEDLRHVARVLATIALERQDATSAEDQAIAIRCETWAGEVAAVALGINGTLDRENGAA